MTAGVLHWAMQEILLKALGEDHADVVMGRRH
jgi:hypothetical protein